MGLGTSIRVQVESWGYKDKMSSKFVRKVAGVCGGGADETFGNHIQLIYHCQPILSTSQTCGCN